MHGKEHSRRLQQGINKKYIPFYFYKVMETSFPISKIEVDMFPMSQV